MILEAPQGWLPERGVLRQIGKAQWGGAAEVSPGQGRGRCGDLEVGTWSECEGWSGADWSGLKLLTGDAEPQAASLVCLLRALPVSQPAYHNCLLTGFLPLPFQPPCSCPIPLQSDGIQISSSWSCSGTLHGSPLPEYKVLAPDFGVVSRPSCPTLSSPICHVSYAPAPADSSPSLNMSHDFDAHCASASLPMPKPLTVWTTGNCGKS